MITIKTEAGLIDVSSWEDITSLPGFTNDVDPKTTKLVEIRGVYTLAYMVPCGLTCRQPHSHGYVIALEGGKTTNLGKDCGSKHFLVEFESKRKQFDLDVRRRDQRELLAAAQHRCHRLTAELEELRSQNRGANWVHKRSQRLLQGGVLPSYVATQISRMVRNRNPTIYLERRETEQEAQQSVAMTERIDRAEGGRRATFVEEQIGSLDGLSALFEENNLKKLLIDDLLPQLEMLRSLDVDQLRDTELGRWGNWVDELDGKLERVRSTVAAGQRLLTPRNINQLTKLARSSEDQRAITQFVRSLADAEGTATIAR